MSERVRVYGLYDYQSKKWIEYAAESGKRLRFEDGRKAYNQAGDYHQNVHPRPFYVKKVKKQKTLPVEVAGVIAAARGYVYRWLDATATAEGTALKKAVYDFDASQKG